MADRLREMKSSQFSFALLFALYGAASSVSAAEQFEPPRFPLDVAPSSTLSSAPASSVALGAVVVQFDETTLSQALGQIGVGNISHRGDAAESVYWLCYSVLERSERLWLLSSGEMGGEEHVIYGIAARASSVRVSTANCPELPRALRPLKLDSAIWLGAPVSDIRKRFGKPSLQQNSWLHYESRRELADDPRAKQWGADTFYEVGGLSVRVGAGKVVELWATKSGSD